MLLMETQQNPGQQKPNSQKPQVFPPCCETGRGRARRANKINSNQIGFTEHGRAAGLATATPSFGNANIIPTQVGPLLE